MKTKERRSLLSMTVRLFAIASEVKGQLFVSTLSSVFTNLAQMSLMGFGVLAILSTSGYTDIGNTYLYLALTLLSIIVIIFGRYFEGFISHVAAYKLLANMRIKMFAAIRKIAPACMTDENKGNILSIAVSDIETIEFFFAHAIGPIITVILLPCITLALAFSVDALFVFALLPIYLVISVILPIISLKLGREIGVRYRRRMGEYQALMLESVYGLVDIQAFSYENRRKQILHNKGVEINKSNHEMTMHRQLVTSAPTFFIYLARILVLFVASYIFTNGNLNTIGAIVLSYVVSASFSSTHSLTMVISSLLETYAAAERIFKIEDTVPAVSESENAVSLQKIGDIEFKNVRFRYDKSLAPVLKDFNLTIKKGEKIGIMGESGIGKTTVLRLLQRFWDVDNGNILLDGISIKDVSLKSLRDRIGSLEQDTLIFNDTIAANIALGKPDASLEQIKQAASKAGMHDFIMTLPNGYDTGMGDMNRQLSGGERQRIGIARIMLLDPDVIVMDEPTSNLDVLSEKYFLKTLKEQYRDKTIIMISHRPSTLSGCDRVLKLQDGALQ